MDKNADSFLLKSMIQLVFLLVNIVSAYLLFRGHQLPGGGFIAGLMTGISFILLGMSKGWVVLRRKLPVDPMRLATAGVTLALLSGLLPVFAGDEFLTQYNWHWKNFPMLGELHVGTPLLFDGGVFLLVSGMTVKLVTVLVRSTAGLRPFTATEERLYASILEEPIEDRARRKEDDDGD